jgi:hypothetical protein
MIKCIPIIRNILISSFKASFFLSLYCILNNLNITQTLSNSNYTYILNVLITVIFIFKISIGYINYKQIFGCIFDIYKFTKNFFISYCTIINYNCYVIDESDIIENDVSDFHDYTADRDLEYRGGNYRRSYYLDDSYSECASADSSIIRKLTSENTKKINILYIKEILILYISHTIYIYTGIYTNSAFFREFKKLNSFIFNEVQRDHYDFKYNNKELHSNYLELLILKNLINLKKSDYLSSSDYSVLYNSFSKLQNSINKLQTLSFKNNKLLYVEYIINIILALELLNLVSYYIIYVQINNNSYLDGLIIFFTSFIMYLINDLSMIFINIFNNLDNIFDCEGYIFNLNDELYLLNYFYISNLEYKI